MNIIFGLASGSLLYYGFSDKNPVTIILGIALFVCAILIS